MEGSSEETLTGHQLGRFRVILQLGRGGRGEVYLAEDSRLNRRVALKTLQSEFLNDRDRLRRFEQEACAASALNHPHILTIHEFGEADGLHFIVTEFIEGVTLRQRMSEERMALPQVLDVASQVASALAAAHQAGIVHRDIKPENIMLRRDGYVKVLDFGLAKLLEQKGRTVDREAATERMIQTAAGVVMGTATYMSPEQARAVEVDARTDIWSLGVVLYEMAAGKPPFKGESTSDVIADILKTEPLPLMTFVADVPAELQRIVRKALRKDPNERYQTIKDMVLDLRNLKRELEIASELEISSQLASSSEKPTRAEGQGTKVAGHKLSAQTESLLTASPTLSAVSKVKRHSTAVMIALAALVFAVVAIAVGVYRYVIQNRFGPVSFQTMNVTKLTSSGNVVGTATNGVDTNGVAISPDGKYVAYIVEDGGKQSIWIRQIATSGNVQITPPAETVYIGLTFSPDGNYIYYVKGEKGLYDLYQMSLMGGVSRKVNTNVSSPSHSLRAVNVMHLYVTLRRALG